MSSVSIYYPGGIGSGKGAFVRLEDYDTLKAKYDSLIADIKKIPRYNMEVYYHRTYGDVVKPVVELDGRWVDISDIELVVNKRKENE